MSGGTSGDDQGVAGQAGLTAPNHPINQHRFQTEQVMGEQRTHFAAKIVKVYNRNSLTEPCTVDIQPLVKQADGIGKTSSHGTIYGIAVPRNQSGDSVVVNDPQVGDTAHFSVFDRDHSSAQANDWQEANPGSKRRGMMSDAVFHATLPRKSQKVKQYVMFTDQGVTIQDRNGNTLTGSSSGWNLNGVMIDSKGNLTAPGNVTAGQGTGDQVTLQKHVHPSNGTPPQPGT